MSELCLVFFS